MQLASVDFSFGDTNNQNLDIHDMRWREAPDDLKQGFKQARRWAKSNEFIKQVVGLKSAFFNHGFKLVTEDRAQKDALTKWQRADARRWRETVRYVNEVVKEWNTQDSVVTFWRDGDREENKTPFLLLPETVKYSDAMGVESLRVCLGYSKKDLQENADGLSDKAIARYSKNEIKLDEAFGEYYRVLTRGLRGQGLAWPEMYSVFRTAAQQESMEVGENQWAFAARSIYEQHTIGFEARNSVTAQSQAKFLYSKTRAADIKKIFTGKLGFSRHITQFDHLIKYVWAGLQGDKAYDARKWETISARLQQWAGPVGYMLAGKQVNPFLLGMLQTVIVQERADFVGPYLEEVLNEAVMPTGLRVKVQWSDRCFRDQRLAWTMVGGLMQQGPLSLTTALEEAGFSPEEEAERKRLEAKPDMDAALLPKYDANHGNAPGGGKQKGKAGRPPGTKDGEGQT